MASMSAISIRTAQNVRLEYEIASIGERLLANVVDHFLFAAWVFLFLAVCDQLGLSFGTAGWIIMLLPIFFYHLACEMFFQGRSVGKQVMQIRVLKKDGSQPSAADYLMRWIFRILECGIALGSIALLTILINGKGQRLGDIAAGTAVVRDREPVRLQDIRPRALPEDYRVSYPEAAVLSDRDIATVRKILRRSSYSGNRQILVPLAEKIRELTGIRPGDPREKARMGEARMETEKARAQTEEALAATETQTEEVEAAEARPESALPGEEAYRFLATVVNDHTYLSSSSRLTL